MQNTYIQIYRASLQNWLFSAAENNIDAEINAALSRNDRVVDGSRRRRVDLTHETTSGAARGTRGYIPVSPLNLELLSLYPRDIPWWKLLENFARRRTGTWNSVVLIPTNFRAPSGPGIGALSAFSRLVRTRQRDKHSSFSPACAFTRSAGARRSHSLHACGWTRLFANPLAESLLGRFPSGSPMIERKRERERERHECSDFEVLEQAARD